MQPDQSACFDLATGVRLYARVEHGAGDAVPVLFLHGFPESHRTWRHQIAALRGTRPLAAPDLRGYGRSDKPRDAAAYRPSELVADVVALADVLGWARFVLAGHDWGGAVAWATALNHPARLAGLVIANAPHPFLFQQQLLRDPAQRAAAQYIRQFRTADYAAHVEAIGAARWFDELFPDHVSRGLIDPAERARYIADWSQPGATTAMLNWYASSPMVVPRPGEAVDLPWLDRPFPRLAVPTLVIWGLADHALLPGQLAGLGDLVDDLRVCRLEGVGHFSPWEAPDPVTTALRAFLDARA